MCECRGPKIANTIFKKSVDWLTSHDLKIKSQLSRRDDTGVRIGTRTGLRVQKYILTYVVNWFLTKNVKTIQWGKDSFYFQWKN